MAYCRGPFWVYADEPCARWPASAAALPVSRRGSQSGAVPGSPSPSALTEEDGMEPRGHRQLPPGAGTARVYPTLLAALGDVARPAWRGAAAGVYRLCRDSGFAEGALVAGLVADAVDIPAAIWVVAALTGASGLVGAVRMYETQRMYETHRPGRPDGQAPTGTATGDAAGLQRAG